MSNVKVTIFDSDSQAGGWPETDSVDDYIKWLHGIINSVPPGTRSKLKINHAVTYSEVSTQVYYFKPKTKVKFETENAAWMTIKILQRDRAFEDFKRLQAEIDAME